MRDECEPLKKEEIKQLYKTLEKLEQETDPMFESIQSFPKPNAKLIHQNLRLKNPPPPKPPQSTKAFVESKFAKTPTSLTSTLNYQPLLRGQITFADEDKQIQSIKN